MSFPNTTQGRFARARLTALLLALVTWLLPTRLAAADAVPVEYQVKAGYLFNFAKFVDWPESAFPATNAPLVIGIVGSDPFGPMLEEKLAGRTVNGRNFVVRRFVPEDDLGACHIVFLSRLGRTSEAKVLENLQGRAVLTVGESEQFGQHGGMINFTLVAGQVKLETNQEAAVAAGLKISSKLLAASRIVKADSPR